jgi:acid phosphatase (class A)
LASICAPLWADDLPASCAPPPPLVNDTVYLARTQVDLTSVLPGPPQTAAGQKQDLDGVLAAQRAAHKAGTTQHAVQDAEVTCARFSDALGYDLLGREAEKPLAFVNKAAMQAASLAGLPKGYWKRPRPYVTSTKVERLADMAPGFYERDYQRRLEKRRAAEAQRDPACGPVAHAPEPDLAAREARWDTIMREEGHRSYPSGHSTFGTACAIILTSIVPEKRGPLFARGIDYGSSRMVVGAHFPTDVLSGRLTGTVAMTLMGQNPDYQHDLALARDELRAAMKLPAELPDLEPPKVVESSK